MQIVVQNLMTRYDKQGVGPKLVLIHGWADKLETYDKLMRLLRREYEVIRLDLPGFGGTEAPKETWNLDSYAQFIHDFLTKLNVDNYVLIGHSNGGAVAIRGIALGLLDPTKLILLASSGVRDTQRLKRTLLKAIAKIGKLVTFWLPKASKQKLQKMLYGTVGSDMLTAPHLQETFRQTVRQDIQRDAVQITIPTLLIYGDQDTATPLKSVGQQLHTRIANSYLKIIVGADHFVHQVAADEVRNNIEEFLQ